MYKLPPICLRAVIEPATKSLNVVDHCDISIYTPNNPHRKKSSGLTSGDLQVYYIVPRLPIHVQNALSSEKMDVFYDLY